MVTVSGDTPAYLNMGELHFNDAEDNPIHESRIKSILRHEKELK